MSLVVPGLVLAGAIVATYLFCVRPMRRGGCPMTQTAEARSAHLEAPGTVSPDLDAEMARTRQALAVLRERAASTEHTPS
ncbi:MAG: hypothetical protein ACYCUG_05775 [Acidimicrobiales bacterium]